MKTAAALLVAASLTVASVVSAQAQNRDTARGPSVDTAKSKADMVSGQVSKIDKEQKIITVKAKKIPGHATQSMTMEYQAKDSSELGRYHVGDWVTGKLSKTGENPPRFETLKVSNKSGTGHKGAMHDGADSTHNPHHNGAMSRDTAQMGGARHDSTTY